LTARERPDGSAELRRGGYDEVLRGLRRRRWLIAACTLVMTAAAVGYSVSQAKSYSAAAGLLFRDTQLGQTLFGSTVLPPSTDPQREAATNVALVGLEAVAEHTAADLGRAYTARSVTTKIAVSAAGQSDVVDVTATDRTPGLAAQLANTYAAEFIAFRQNADRAKIAGAQQLVQTQLTALEAKGQASSPSAISLDRYAQQLGILASLQTGNAELVQKAQVPTSPSSPKTSRNAVLGAFLGLMLGLAAAFLAERRDERIKDPGELEEIYGLPVLADVPESPALGDRPGTADGLAVPEAFRMLRTRLRYFDVDEAITTLMVTSVGPAEGKTTIAQNLAAAAATTESSRVLLLEADLRRPRIGANLGLRATPGLAEVLTHGRSLDDAIQRIVLVKDDGVRDEKTLDVLLAGISPPNPAELLQSDKMAGLLERLAAIYDLVVIDTPPAGLVADAIPLMGQVTGIVVVASVGLSSRARALAFRDQLAQLGGPVLGVVANRVKPNRADGFYGYGYGSYTDGNAGPQARWSRDRKERRVSS
jgi:capsular exopolysaccharide synthesis family protein